MSNSNKTSSSKATSKGVWSKEEHARFQEAMQLFPKGPWKAVADHVGTRSIRQVQTHAQQCHEKVARRLRGLRVDRPERRLGDKVLEICNELQNDTSVLPSKKRPQHSKDQETPTSVRLPGITVSSEIVGQLGTTGGFYVEAPPRMGAIRLQQHREGVMSPWHSDTYESTLYNEQV